MTCKRKHTYQDKEFDTCEDCNLDPQEVWCEHCGDAMCCTCANKHCCCSYSE